MLVPIGAGVSLEVADSGSGPVVVLLHGWPVTALHWRRIVPALNQAGFRTLSVQARGLGAESTGPGDLAKQTLAREVVGVLDAIGVRRFALLGHGMGGTIASLVAAEQPYRLVALALEETLPPALRGSLPERGRRTQPDWIRPLLRAPHRLAEGLLVGRMDLTVDAYLTQSAGPAGLDFDVHLAYVGAYAADERIPATLALFRTDPEDAAAIRRAERRRLRIPGFAIGGRDGAGVAVAEGLARLVSGVRSIEVPEAAHYPAEQAPDPVARALVQFLRTVS